MQRFTELKVWQRSHAFALTLYRLTARFPAEECYGLTAQMRRAAVSVPANIAEGSKRLGRQDYVRFLNLSEGSLAEVEYLLMLSRDLGYLENQVSATCLAEADEIARMLSSLRAKVGRGK